MSDLKKGIILVGHGGIPKGYPADLVSKLKRLEAQRRAAGQPMSAEELELDTKIRTWPRNTGNRSLSGRAGSLGSTDETHGEWCALCLSL
jgi:hypothetical protein